jgi:uncharacterized protein YjaZ
MEIDWLPTNEYYHRIIEAPDAGERRRLYLELLVGPWRPMMAAMVGEAALSEDPLAGARAWAWLLPDDLAQAPESLAALEAAGAWTVAAEALAEGAARFAAYEAQMPVDRVEGWLVLADPARSDPVMRGYTGAVDWFAPRFIGQYDTPNAYNVARLPGLVVHEMHHLIRLRLFPWHMAQTTVADYMIHEGLAESFAASLFGETSVGYFVTEFDEGELNTARRLIGEGLDRTGFDVLRAYIFGDYWSEKLGLPKLGVPTYGGYAIGYHVAQAFLERTGKTVAEATFLPAEEIVRRSGFFAKSRQPWI